MVRGSSTKHGRPAGGRERDSRPGGVFGLAARVIVRLRLLIVVLWLAAAVAAAVKLPSLFAAETASLGSLLPPTSDALVAEREATEKFKLPLLSHTIAVVSQERALTGSQVSGAVRYVARADSRPFTMTHLRALPLMNAPGLAPGGEPTRSFIANLYIDPDLSESESAEVATSFAAGLRRASGAEEANVTGDVPASWAQSKIAEERLLWLEIATVAIVVGVLAFYFGALGVPLMGVATVAISYVLADHVLGWMGRDLGVAVPPEVDPVIVALLFGTLTDYVVFLTSSWRRKLAEGADPRQAAIEASAALLPVILAAALMIAGALATMMLSGVSFLSSFGPGMAISVLIGALVAVTFVPALLALVGHRLLWPRGVPEATLKKAAAKPSLPLRAAAAHPLLVSLVCIVALGAAASGLRKIELGNPVITGLPSSSGPRRGYEAMREELGPGAAGPTMVTVEKKGLVEEGGQLSRLQAMLARQSGVAFVLGPADEPDLRPYGVFRAPEGDAARYAIVLDTDPNSAQGIASLTRLKSQLSEMSSAAGLGGTQVAIAGDTAIATELNDRSQEALLRITPVALIVLMIVLALLLGSRGAPIYLVAVSALVVAAALGLAVYLFQDLLGYGELVFFAPVAAAILLLALGSDYNVFLASRIWSHAGRMGLRPAIRTAGSRAARDITIAGVTLALSFAAVVLVPILAFRQLAFIMCAGLLLDVFIARPLLIPALIALFGGGGSKEEAKEAKEEPSAPSRKAKAAAKEGAASPSRAS